MNPTVKKYRTKEKVKIKSATVVALKKDRKRFLGKLEHIEAIGISYLSYEQIMKDRKARTDVVEKIENYLLNVA